MAVDPITVEIVQNRLHQIGWEAGTVLVRTAASPVSVEAKDIGFNICDHLGRIIVYSVWMPRHGTTLNYMLHSCQRFFGPDGIGPGDIIMVNNPHDGALHVSDVAIISPVYSGSELVAWAACATHHTDIGGMTAGWSPTATDWFQEGLKMPPIKLAEGGRFRDDVFNLFLTNVRLPDFQAHDIRAQIASNNFASEKVCELVDRYGLDTIRACYEDIIDLTEQKTRQRLRQIRNGRYSCTDYLDYERLYELRCTLEVEDGELTFDFTGSAEQAGSFVNGALPCSVANLHNIVTCLLVPDIPANEGSFRPVHVVIPEGTIFNCRRPAACSGSSVTSGWKIQCLTLRALSLALRASPGMEHLANASWGSGMIQTQYSAYRANRWITGSSMEGTMQGGGGRANKDGVNVSNIPGSTNTSVPNVEYTELRYPILYHHRRLRRDSEGPGYWRGGVGGEYAWTPYHTDRVDLTLFYIGGDVPAEGLAGGLPGSLSTVTVKRGSDIFQRFAQGDCPDLAELQGEDRVVNKTEGRLSLVPGDILFSSCQGGGGFGDPLTRDPARVCSDVDEGVIDAGRARDVYGVELEGGPGGAAVPDQARTAQRRKEARSRRLTASRREDPGVALTESIPDLGTCPDCGADWRPVVREVTREELGLKRGLQYFRVIAYTCSQCGTQCEAPLALRQEPE